MDFFSVYLWGLAGLSICGKGGNEGSRCVFGFGFWSLAACQSSFHFTVTQIFI